MRRLVLLLAVLFTPVLSLADTIGLEPGTTIKHKIYTFNVNAPMQGQTLTFNLDTGDEFLVGKDISLSIYLNESGPIGTWPFTNYVVSGGLNNQSVNFTLTGEMPAQFHPNWGFINEFGQLYLPATAIYEAEFRAIQEEGFFTPQVVTSLSYMVTLPVFEGVDLIGVRALIYAPRELIQVSPAVMPVYAISEASGWLLTALGVGTLGLGSLVVGRRSSRL